MRGRRAVSEHGGLFLFTSSLLCCRGADKEGGSTEKQSWRLPQLSPSLPVVGACGSAGLAFLPLAAPALPQRPQDLRSHAPAWCPRKTHDLSISGASPMAKKVLGGKFGASSNIGWGPLPPFPHSIPESCVLLARTRLALWFLKSVILVFS